MCVCVCVCVCVGRDSVRVRDCLYSLPARVSFEMQQAGFTIIETEFIKTSEREHSVEEVAWPILVPAAS